MTLHDILSRLDVKSGNNGRYMARCPCHNDQQASLSVGVGDDGRVLLHCFAGCDTTDIMQSMGLTMRDLFIELKPGDVFPVYDRPTDKAAARFEAEYIYPGGIFKKVKMRKPDGGKFNYWMHREGSQWVKGRNGMEPGLYVTESPLPDDVYIVEGEKDVDTMKVLGAAAVSLPDGAKSKWQPEYGKALEKRRIVIIQDNDAPGKAFAQRVAGDLYGIAQAVKVLDLSEVWPEIPAHGDVSDMVAAFGADKAAAKLIELEQKTQLWTPHTEKSAGFKLVKASEIPYEPPRWAIAPYFQRGKGTMIQGDNGSGKTAFMCAITAHMTTGRALLGIPIDAPGDVLLLSVEDDLPVLRGRIEANGGDLDKCHFITNAAGLTFNSPEIEAAIKQVNAKMVIFDPFQAFLGAGVDMFRSNETRPELAKLFEMCERNDCACAIIAHIGKAGGDRSPVNRALGSVDIPAAMRSILQLIRNPNDKDECVMVHVKCSNAPKGQSIAYTIGDRGGVHWKGFSPMAIEDLACIQKRKEKGIPYEREPLVQVFNQLVTDKPGGGFWSYEDVKSIGAKLLGFPPFYSVADLKQKLNSSFCRELQEKDGLIVTCGHRSHGERGIRIEQYQVPDGYQTKITNE